MAPLLSIPDIIDFTKFFENGIVYPDKNDVSKLESVDWIFFEHLLVRVLIPLATLVFFYGSITLKIQTAQAVLRNIDGNHKTKKRRKLQMIFWIVFAFIFLSLIPRLLYRSLEYFDPAEKGEWMRAIVNMMVTTNSSLNFIIYCLLDKTFKRINSEMTSYLRDSYIKFFHGDSTIS